jgi:hypothetical protein
MRTTLTLDDDISAMLESLQKSENKSFKQLVNDVLRLGLMQVRNTARRETVYSTPVFNSKALYPDLDNISDILALAEKEDYK